MAQNPLADWLIKFGAPEMVIAYCPIVASTMTWRKLLPGHRWYEVLSNPNLKFGRTNPQTDPKGYISIIVAELVNKYI